MNDFAQSLNLTEPETLSADEKRDAAAALYASGSTLQEIGDQFGVVPSTVYRWLHSDEGRTLVNQHTMAIGDTILRSTARVYLKALRVVERVIDGDDTITRNQATTSTQFALEFTKRLSDVSFDD